MARPPRLGTLLGRVLLRFDQQALGVPQDLSAAVQVEGDLWVAADEKGALERLTREHPRDPRVYGSHHRFHLAHALDLSSQDEEIDLEALDCDDGALWVIGSHSPKRKKPRKKDSAQDLARLATVELEPSRLVLARLPLQKRSPLTARAARLPLDGQDGNPLLQALREDPHLGPFIRAGIPGKDNGLDIEGLAVRGDRVLLGLRGPVLRGWAVLLDLTWTLERGHLALSRPHRKHLLELDGLGIRELAWHGPDLLLLAAPTMSCDGPARLFRLRDLEKHREDRLVPQKEGLLEPLFDLPHEEEQEHPEGLALYSWFDRHDSVLVLYDSPRPERLHGANGVLADVYRL